MRGGGLKALARLPPSMNLPGQIKLNPNNLVISKGDTPRSSASCSLDNPYYWTFHGRKTLYQSSIFFIAGRRREAGFGIG